MKTAPERVVFDSSAVLAFFLLERGGAEVKTELRACRKGTREGWISAASVAEVHRRLRASRDAAAARRELDSLCLTPLAILPVDREIAQAAADLARDADVGLFDCFVAASAWQLGATVVTADSDFHRLEDRVTVRFIR
ncbi:MAG: PIN domain-containing protein [Planctomycetota bacterium]|mgnify:CR=1 FL=1